MVVVGVGALGQHHARIISQMSGVNLTAVVELSREVGERIAKSCGTRWLDDYHQVFGDVDAAVIAVPTAAHLAVASEFLKQRIPVLVEKPLAGELQHAQMLVDLAEREHTLLQVGHIERFNPALQAARPFIGNPRHVRSERLSPFSFRSTDIGVVHDLMIHDIDLLLSMVPAPISSVEACGFALMGEREDFAQAHIVFQNGCIAELTASRIHQTASRTMQVWSSSGWVTIDFQSRKIDVFSPSDELKFGMSPVKQAQQPDADIAQLKSDVFGKLIHVGHPVADESDALTAELTSFVNCVIEGKSPLVDGVQALAAMDAADQILESLNRRGWDSDLGQAQSA
jgi:predicted dehydrogenase